jgi:hypothetical protein
MANMDEYFRDNDGNIATLAVRPGLASGVPFNVAMRDFPIGPRVTVFKDPAEYSFTTSSSNVNGTTFTATTVTSGTVRNGLILWSSPGTSGLLTNHPVLSNCTGGTPAGGSGTVCTLSISQSNKSGPYKGSHAPGCYWTDGGASSSSWNCDFKYPNQALIADFDGFDFGAIGGHTSSTLLVTSSDNGVPTLKVTNSHIVVDAQTNGQTIIRTNPAVRANFIVEDNEFDGGNASVATGEPVPANFNYSVQTGGFGSGFEGISGNHITGSFKRNWIHDFAGNPIQISNAYADIITQANVFYRIGMNNGNNIAGGQTGLHGASINWNTTTEGTTGTIRRYNDVVIYPYGTRPGVTTGPFALLGGTGSASTIGYDQQLTTSIVNVAAPSQAISSQWFTALRVGALSNLTIKNNYVSTIGIVHNGCYLIGGDIQGSTTASMAPSVGNGYSIWTVSGLVNGSLLPYPGQYITTQAASGTTRWRATLTDLGDGTSRMDITSTQVGTTTALSVGIQVAALRMLNPKTNPTLIVSQIDSDSYIVSNGSGNGETRAEQSFRGAQVIQDFGSHGTTATGGSNSTNYNGTYAVGQERTVASTLNWHAVGQGLAIGNLVTIDDDVTDNFDVLSGNALTADDISLSFGSCPGTNPQ